MGEVLVPFTAILTFFTLIGLIFYYHTTTRHKERMAMLEKGFSADQIRSIAHRVFKGRSPLGSLQWGIIILAVGLAIIVGNFLRTVYNVDESVIAGLIFLFGGLGLVIFYFIAAKKMGEPDEHPEE
jgi:ABC-type Mn2+/Zn2+ transport system permease subunit